MIKFDATSYIEQGKSVYARRSEIEQIAKELADKNYENLFLLGIGGTEFSFQPFAYFADKKSKSDVCELNATLLGIDWPKKLSSKSLVITSSISGTTKETVEATEKLVEAGVDVVAFAPADTLLAKAATSFIDLKLGENGGIEHVTLLLTFLIYGYLYARGEFEDYPSYANQIVNIYEELANVREKFDDQADEIAQKYYQAPYTVVTGAGSLWGETMMYAMCFMEEMQWIRTRPCRADQFFHGCLEIVQDDVPVLILKGEDEYREVSQRVENFCKQINANYVVFDTADYQIEGLDKKFRPLVSHWIMCVLLDDRLSSHYEKYTGHDMNIRRYYRKFDY